MAESRKERLKDLVLLPFWVLLFLLILIIYPFWLLFTRVVNWVGLSNLRTMKGDVQTPVVYFLNQNTKRMVILVGVVHLGEKSYYAQIRELLASLDGFTVLYEWIKALSDEEKSKLTEKSEKIVKEFESYGKSSRMICEILGLQPQKEGLPIEAKWINTDVRAFELINYFVNHNLNFMKDIGKIEKLLGAESDQVLDKWLLNGTFKRIIVVMVFAGFYSKLTRKRRLKHDFLINQRNVVAVEGIREHLAKGNVVAIWGAGHLPGIAKMLKQDGFSVVGKEWYTAYKAKDCSFWDVFADRSVVAVERLAAISDQITRIKK